MTLSLLPALVAFVVALVTPVMVLPLLRRLGVMDVPNARSSHDGVVVRGAGIAQLCGFAAGLFIGYLNLAEINRLQMLAVVCASCAAALLGLVEDLRGVPIALRAGFQLLIGLFTTAAIALNTGQTVWWAVLGGFAMVGGINVVNFMDGIDAISSLHGIIAGVTLAVVGHLDHTDWLVVTGAVLAGSYAAFLPWNLRGRMFLGDVGSYLLGGALASAITLGWMSGSSIVGLAGSVLVYVADTGVTLVGRIAARETWYDAHRDHTYQRLNRAGTSHLAVASYVSVASAICAGAGVGFSETQGVFRLGFLVVIVVVIAAYTILRFILGRALRTTIPAEVS